MGLMQGELGEVSPDCRESLSEQTEYIGKSHLILMHDQVLFRPDRFGEEKLERTSVILNQQFDQMSPTWLSTKIQDAELQDETGFV